MSELKTAELKNKQKQTIIITILNPKKKINAKYKMVLNGNDETLVYWGKIFIKALV